MPSFGWCGVSSGPAPFQHMVKMLKKCPDCFRHLEPGHWFFELYDTDGAYGYAAMYFEFRPNCSFHLEITRFSHRIFKMLKKVDWPVALDIMGIMKVKRIIATRPGTKEDTGHRTYNKLLKYFSFVEPQNYTLSQLVIEDEKNGSS